MIRNIILFTALSC